MRENTDTAERAYAIFVDGHYCGQVSTKLKPFVNGQKQIAFSSLIEKWCREKSISVKGVTYQMIA